MTPTAAAPTAIPVPPNTEPHPSSPTSELSVDFAETVTLHVAVFPSAVVTVTVVVPAFSAVTTPFLSTTATLSSEDFQLID